MTQNLFLGEEAAIIGEMGDMVDIEQFRMVSEVLRDDRLVFFEDNRQSLVNGEICRQGDNESDIVIGADYQFEGVIWHQQ